MTRRPVLRHFVSCEARTFCPLRRFGKLVVDCFRGRLFSYSSFEGIRIAVPLSRSISSYVIFPEARASIPEAGINKNSLSFSKSAVLTFRG